MFERLRDFWQEARQLRDLGVLGMNERNLSFIGRHNPRSRFPLVDNKLQTKLLAKDYEIATPELLGVIRHQAEIAQFTRMTQGHQGFAIKPAKGSGGKGILVVCRSQGDRFQKASGEWITRHQVERHLSNLISGLYSLGGHPDVAIIESLIVSVSAFEDFTFEGVPDIRVVVYRGYPVMAMMRLSTHASDGKANLHQGAIGVGIDLNTGKAVRGVQFDRPVTHHPDTGKSLNALAIEDWPQLLALAARCYDMTRLGYIGVDLVLDASRGPLLLELNARPGLAIQLANACGLKPRLASIDNFCDQIKGPELGSQQRVEVACQYFK